MKWVRRLDFFGFIPSFRIDGKKELKSIVGGFSTFTLIILSICYLSYSINDYIKNFNNIATSRTVTSNSQKYILQAIDAYYGVGFTDKNGVYINITQFEFLDIYFQYTVFNKTSKQSIVQTVPFEKCEREIFIPNNEFDLINNDRRTLILDSLKYFICPNKKFIYELQPYDFSTDDYTISIKIDLKNNSNLNSIQKTFDTFSPILNFLYQQYTINSDSKFHPYIQTIGVLTNELGLYFSKTIQLYLNPYNILDDLNPIGNGDYISLDQKEFTSQPNATIFQTTRWADYSRYYPNRNPNLNVNTSNFPDLNLIKISISLGSLITTTFRTYRKFNEFFAGVSSIISNSFVGVAIMVTYINTIKGTNSMIRSLYDKNKIMKLNELNKKFKSISIVETNKGKNKNKLNKVIKQISGKKKGRDIIETLFKEKRSNDSVKIIQKESDIQEGKILRVKTKIENKIEIMMNDEINFTFKDYFMMKFCRKQRSYELIENALQNIEELLDINTYMKFKLEMELVLQVLFDENQKASFEILSSLLNFNKIFEQHEKNSINDQEKSENLFESLNVISSRYNETDQKIISFIRQILAI